MEAADTNSHKRKIEDDGEETDNSTSETVKLESLQPSTLDGTGADATGADGTDPLPPSAHATMQEVDDEEHSISKTDFPNMQDFLNEKKKYNRKWTPQEVVAYFFVPIYISL